MNSFTKQKQSHRCRKQTYGYQGGRGGGDKFGIWDEQIHTTMNKIDDKQGPTVQHRELYSIFCNNL